MEEDQCIECGDQLEDSEMEASETLFGKYLCWNCMKEKIEGIK